MPGVLHNYNQRLPKTTWPQDTLVAPSGNGQLTAIDTLNEQKVRREYFSYVTKFTALTYSGATQEQQVPIAKDGDFWMVSVRIAAVLTSGGTPTVNNAIYGYFTLKDSLTGYNLYNPFVPIKGLLSGTNIATTFQQWIMEPYCFMRTGNISMTVTLPFASASTRQYDLYVTLDGWKEYANAAK